MRHPNVYVIITLVLFLLPANSFSQVAITGEHVILKKESPHPYSAALEKGTITWTDTIKYTAKEATFISIHFEKFNLADGDKLIVRSPNNARKIEYGSEYNKRGSLWCGQFYDNEVIIEIVSNANSGAYGYKIDKIARGFTSSESAIVNSYDYNNCHRIDELKEERCSFIDDTEGTWYMTLMGDRKFSKNENRTFTFTFFENQHDKPRNLIAASVGCNITSAFAYLEKNNINLCWIEESHKSCDNLELENELNVNFRRINQYELENRLLILKDKEDEIIFVLSRNKE